MPASLLLRLLVGTVPFAVLAWGLAGPALQTPRPLFGGMVVAGVAGLYLLCRGTDQLPLALAGAAAFGGILLLGGIMGATLDALLGEAPWRGPSSAAGIGWRVIWGGVLLGLPLPAVRWWQARAGAHV